MTLPDQSNLVRWGKASEKTCYTCREAVGTARHLLAGCKVLLDRGYYSRRHDRVLEIIREAVSLSVARAQKGVTTNQRQINFVKGGSTVNSKSKLFSIIGTAPDWTILMDTYDKHYKIPEDVGVSSSRPDIFLFSKHIKHIILVELTVPWETNIPKDHTIKLNKYYDLTNALNKNGYVVNLYAVEVGARGIPAKSLYNLLKDLGLSRTAINSILERASKAALTGSYQIWLGRAGNSSGEGER